MVDPHRRVTITQQDRQMSHILGHEGIPFSNMTKLTAFHTFNTDLCQEFVILSKQRQDLRRAHLERFVYAIKHELKWCLSQAQIID